ncbi:MAG: hypothetical protein GX228_05150 [Firmicutes bacterium]|nr:hypothetical protein [Bacillota bacterium]NLL88309.1 hypothetical protein [Bacillota bacterium]HKM16696.1 hypothetical protein [Limnochordia bacterium]
MPYKDYDYELYRHELEDQLNSGLEWDESPEHYERWQDWDRKAIHRPNLELAKELTMISVPHKTRRFRKP